MIWLKNVLIVFSLDVQAKLMPSTIANLVAARDYCLTHPVDIVIFTGGLFNQQKGQTRPAAELMNEWWQAQGQFPRYPETICENNSLITRENVPMTVINMAQHDISLGDCRIVATSDFWHLLGIGVLFLRLYGKWIRICSSKFRLPLKYIVERLAKAIYYLAFPRGDDAKTQQVVAERGGGR